jgi:hypothetical protein
MFVGLAIGRPRFRRTPRPPDASHAIPPRVLRFEASRHARITSPLCWVFGLGFEAQTKKPSSDGFVGKLLTVKIRQPSHEFTFGVGMTFVSYSLVLTPVV